MKSRKSDNGILGNHIARIALGTVLVLLVPLVFTLLGSGVDGQGVHWTLSDFIIMGALIFIAGLAIDLILRKAGKYRVYAGIAIVFLFLWLWTELAVGVFTNWGS
jgi:hypothetical protein